MQDNEDIIVKDYDCHACGSQYKIVYELDEVELLHNAQPEFCPFCGAQDHGDVDNNLGIGFDENAKFGKGVEHMDDDGEWNLE